MLRKFAPFLFGFSVFLLLLVLIPGLGQKVGGAQRWLRIGGFSCQPSEIVKLTLILYLANRLTRAPVKLSEWRESFLPCGGAIIGVAFLTLLEPDFGTAFVFLIIGGIFLFISGCNVWHLLSVGWASLPCLFILIRASEYRWQRVLTHFNPWQDPQGSGFQIIQSLYALGSGGLFGVGLGASQQKLFFLPTPHTDFIFSVIGEELGFIGSCFVIFLFTAFIFEGIRIALRAKELFGCLVAAGYVILVGIGVVINLGVGVGLLPTKGASLPFISAGGSSLIVNMAGLGILMNVSKPRNIFH
jgi:cell division protein FtsW